MRTIANSYGNPTYDNPLPSLAAATRPRFQIATSEHRIYDLEEGHKFCSDCCLDASMALAVVLPHDRPYEVPLAEGITTTDRFSMFEICFLQI
jgi:RNA polymerase II-associated protein 2